MDKKCFCLDKQQLVKPCVKISGNTNMPNVAINYMVNKTQFTTFADAFGNYLISVPLCSNVAIRPVSMPIFKVSPRQITLKKVQCDVGGMNFNFIEIPREIIISISRAVLVEKAYMLPPNTWKLSGEKSPDLYMLDKIVIDVNFLPEQVKWDVGTHEAEHFHNHGNDITDTYKQGVPATEGDYTVYIKHVDGKEFVEVITINNIRNGTNDAPYLLLDYFTAENLDDAIPGISVYVLDFMQGGGNKLSAHYELYENINMFERTWTPLGTEAEAFNGSINGNNNTIANFQINAPGNDYVALTAHATSGAVFKNLSFENCNLNGQTYVSALVAVANMTDGGEMYFENCHILSGSLTAQNRLGGMLSFTNGNTGKIFINNCSSDSAISCVNYAGGIAGLLLFAGNDAGIVLTNSHNNGVFNCNIYNGGMIGELRVAESATFYIENCYNTGNIICGGYTSGIVGSLSINYGAGGIINSCFNSADITGLLYLGGIVGISSIGIDCTNSVSNCYNNGNILPIDDSRNRLFNGGIFGYLGNYSGASTAVVDIKNCYFTGQIISSFATLETYLGGIFAGSSATIPGRISKNVSCGNLLSGSTTLSSIYISRILGRNNAAQLSDNLAYNNMQVLVNGVQKSPLSEGSSGTDGISVTKTAIKSFTTYENLGWNFNTTWTFGNEEYTLPILKNISADVQPKILPPHLM